MIPGMARTSPSVELSAADQTRLQQWQSAHGTPQQVVAVSVGLIRCGGTTRLGHRFCLWSQPPYRRTVAGGESWKPGSTRSGRHKPVGVVNRSMTCPSAMR